MSLVIKMSRLRTGLSRRHEQRADAVEKRVPEGVATVLSCATERHRGPHSTSTRPPSE